MKERGMTSVAVMGSCLTNLASVFLISEYKWTRPTYAALLRSDYFVEQFLDEKGGVPPRQEFMNRVRWHPGAEDDAENWLHECYRETVGHRAIPLDQPGLFEVFETQQIDVVLMDNMHDTQRPLFHYRAKPGEESYNLPFMLNYCANAEDFAADFYYGSAHAPSESVRSWLRIIQYVKQKQPNALIMFYCAHANTSIDIPDRYERTRAFHGLFAPPATELGVTVIPPLELPFDLTRMPEDREHFEWLVYRAMAGQIFLAHSLRRGAEAVGANMESRAA